MRSVALERIAWHTARGDRVVVVSAALDVYLEPWCATMGVDVICTQLEAHGGRVTGRYVTRKEYPDRHERRLWLVRDRMGVKPLYWSKLADGTVVFGSELRALRRLEAGGPSQTFNLGTERPTSVREIVAAVERVTGRTVASSVAARRPGDPAVLYASAVRAREELGWVPARPAIDTIVGDAWRWHQKRQDLPPSGSR